MQPTRRLWMLAVLSCLCVARPTLANGTASTPFAIVWTAPGDDGLVGRATSYELRCSPLPITEANFGLATRITGMPAPQLAGTQQTFVVSGLPDTVGYYLAIKTVDEVGNWSGISNVFSRPASWPTLGVPTLVLSFSSPYPNPCRESVSWTFSLPQAARVQLDVFDVLGRHVRNVEDGLHLASADVLTWDLRDESGRAVGAGVYFVRAQIGPVAWTKRLTVVR